MARSVGNEIPAEIRPLFAGADLAAPEGLTFLLLSTTESGWPHVAMLSVGEVLGLDERHLRLALWRGSTASTNLAQTGQATLALVHDGAAYSLRCTARGGADLRMEGHGALTVFDLQVAEALEDVAPYAQLTSGVTFRLNDPDEVLPRWRETIAALRRHT